MKTTGQDAKPKPGRECSTCGTKLTKDEYELCQRCREELEAERRENIPRPTVNRKEEEW